MVEAVPHREEISIRYWVFLWPLLLIALLALAWYFWPRGAPPPLPVAHPVRLSPPPARPTGNADPGARGNISFTLVWTHKGSTNVEGPDIDIFVDDPLTQRLSTSNEGFALGPTPEGGEIDFDDRGGWGAGDGGGPERVYWPDGQAPVGSYSYGVNFYAGDGVASYVLRVYKKNVLFTEHAGTLDTAGKRETLGAVSCP